jgi:hypothetical protein
MLTKYIIYNGEDFGMFPNSLEVSLNLKSDEGRGYSELEIKFPVKWDLIKWKTGDVCSVISDKDGHFFLFLDFKVKNVYSDRVILTSKQYVDFQPIIKLGVQI